MRRRSCIPRLASSSSYYFSGEEDDICNYPKTLTEYSRSTAFNLLPSGVVAKMNLVRFKAKLSAVDAMMAIEIGALCDVGHFVYRIPKTINYLLLLT